MESNASMRWLSTSEWIIIATWSVRSSVVMNWNRELIHLLRIWKFEVICSFHDFQHPGRRIGGLVNLIRWNMAAHVPDAFRVEDAINKIAIALRQMFLWTVILSRRKYSSLMQPMHRLCHRTPSSSGPLRLGNKRWDLPVRDIFCCECSRYGPLRDGPFHHLVCK